MNERTTPINAASSADSRPAGEESQKVNLCDRPENAPKA